MPVVSDFSDLLFPLWRARKPAPLPGSDDLPDPPQSDLDADAVKAAIDQVHKRQDAQLALKTATETRAMILAGQSLTVLVALTGAAFLEATSAAPRGALLAAAGAGGVCLFVAVLFALGAARPRDFLLSGRLPNVLWEELLAPGMKGPEFGARYLKSMQDGMAANEALQYARANLLIRSLVAFVVAVPAAIAAGMAFHYASIFGIA